MTIAKLFRNGRSQAVRIPKDLEFETDQVAVIRKDGGLFLVPVSSEPWSTVRKVAEEASRYPDVIPSAPEQKRDLTW